LEVELLILAVVEPDVCLGLMQLPPLPVGVRPVVISSVVHAAIMASRSKCTSEGLTDKMVFISGLQKDSSEEVMMSS
jgi:hypothetical protein